MEIVGKESLPAGSLANCYASIEKKIKCNLPAGLTRAALLGLGPSAAANCSEEPSLLARLVSSGKKKKPGFFRRSCLSCRPGQGKDADGSVSAQGEEIGGGGGLVWEETYRMLDDLSFQALNPSMEVESALIRGVDVQDMETRTVTIGRSEVTRFVNLDQSSHSDVFLFRSFLTSCV